MKLFTLLLFIFLSFSPVFAFDIETVDETKEGIEKAKKKAQEIIRASDGKVIMKVMPRTIIKPMKATIIKGYKPTVKPIKRKIIYPIGTMPPMNVEQEPEEPSEIPKKEEDNVFLSSDSISNKKADEININIDTDFKKSSGATTTEKPQNISPVNIE